MKNITSIVALIGVAFALAACGDSGSGSERSTRYSLLYTAADGTIHAESHDDNGLLGWYILYLNTQPATTSSVSLSGSSTNLSGTSWRPAPSAPVVNSLTKTDTVVETDEKGEPAADSAEDASEVPAEDVVDANTTAEEAQADAAEDASADAAAEDNSPDSPDTGNDSSNEVSPDSGSDSFDSGGDVSSME